MNYIPSDYAATGQLNPFLISCGRHVILHTNLDYIFQACTEGNVLHLDDIERK